MLFRRPPALEHVKRLASPPQAERLAELLVTRSGLDPYTDESRERYNHQLGIRSLFSGQGTTPQSLLSSMCAEILPEPEEADLLCQVAGNALSRMSGLRRGGLPGHMEPRYLGLDVNVYAPDEIFPTHTDKGMANDVVAITLMGEGEFMHAARRGTTPTPMPADRIRSWDMTPGNAIAIRNHQLADLRNDGSPYHAVQNGSDVRVTLQVQVSYDW